MRWRGALLNWARLVLLRWRVIRGRALPAVAMLVLRQLDRWAERAIDKAWTPAASTRVDRILARKDRGQ